MGFWLFMLITSLLIPLVMIGFGRRSCTNPPARINHLYGYRTQRSMKNQDTWVFAHRVCGKFWVRWGCVLLPLSAVCMLAVLYRSDVVAALVAAGLCTLQCIPLFLSIAVTERALKETFDENGARRDTFEL